MPSTFFGLEIGSRALSVESDRAERCRQQHGQHRYAGLLPAVVNLDETDPYTPPDSNPTRPGELGTGVTVASINRVRDQFIDRRVWDANAQQAGVEPERYAGPGGKRLTANPATPASGSS